MARWERAITSAHLLVYSSDACPDQGRASPLLEARALSPASGTITCCPQGLYEPGTGVSVLSWDSAPGLPAQEAAFLVASEAPSQTPLAHSSEDPRTWHQRLLGCGEDLTADGIAVMGTCVGQGFKGIAGCLT